jgi:uncharacterized protein (TIGR03437 family)
MTVVKNRIYLATLLAASMLPAAFAQSTSFTTASAGNWSSIVAPDSIAAGFGTGFATGNTPGTLPLQTTLGGATVTITDSAGVNTAAPLFMVSSGQINYLVPANAALGKGTISATANGTTFTGNIQISNVSPAIFTANNNGSGVAAAQLINVAADGTVTTPSPYQTGVLSYATKPIDISSGKVYLVLYGTGIRRHSANPVKASIGGVAVPVLFAAAQGSLPGLDQINLGPLPQTLANTGKGDVNLVVTVDGVPANVTLINIK